VQDVSAPQCLGCVKQHWLSLYSCHLVRIPTGMVVGRHAVYHTITTSSDIQTLSSSSSHSQVQTRAHGPPNHCIEMERSGVTTLEAVGAFMQCDVQTHLKQMSGVEHSQRRQVLFNQWPSTRCSNTQMHKTPRIRCPTSVPPASYKRSIRNHSQK